MTRFKELKRCKLIEKFDVSIFWRLDVLSKEHYDLPIRRGSADMDKLDQDTVSDLIEDKIKRNNQSRFLTPQGGGNKHQTS